MYRKYHNKKTFIDGIKFDSKLEAERYAQLKMMECAGVIRDLELQPEYELIPSFRKNDKTWRRTVYKADFRYILCEDDSYIIQSTQSASLRVKTSISFKEKQKSAKCVEIIT